MMTSPKPKLTELLDWIDSHLVYCFSLIRNKYFHTYSSMHLKLTDRLDKFLSVFLPFCFFALLFILVLFSSYKFTEGLSPFHLKPL